MHYHLFHKVQHRSIAVFSKAQRFFPIEDWLFPKCCLERSVVVVSGVVVGELAYQTAMTLITT